MVFLKIMNLRGTIRMKKWILLVIFISSSLFSEDIPIVCAGKVPWLNEQFKNEPRYFYLSTSGQGDITVGDTQTIEIDKKNKIVKIWTTNFISYKSQADDIKKYGQKYSDFGYIKNLIIFDFVNKKIKILSSLDYTCDGNVIYSSSNEGNWGYVIPNSVGETQFMLLKQKYGF